ncbi:MAG: PAS domain-containing protein [Polyangiaceae bacterium]|nr:PAS domain-containing protein [Polyangiaceae bacterium]
MQTKGMDGAAQGPEGSPLFVVGVGASAGGLEALELLLRAAPTDAGLAYVVVQHLSPDHKSHMVELLSKHTQMPVVAAADGTSIVANRVYLIPPKKHLTVRDGALHLHDRGSGLSLPVDLLFKSLALEYGERAAGVVLSGTGSDGVRGVRAIKEGGGLVIVQDPITAKFDGMPRAAISTGHADYIVPVSTIPKTLITFAGIVTQVRYTQQEPSASEEEVFANLAGLLRRQTGVDFTKYKSTTVMRRIHRRMAILQIETLTAYLDVCRKSPDELSSLFRELLISVTRFFRDGDAFEIVRREVIPALIEKSRPGESIRVWVPGCATGEEAYSLAILFEEYFENGGRPRDVKIFATDIDRNALELASAGVYPDSIAADVSPERLSQFFVRRDDGYQVARFIRKRVVFANHDLSRDPPFSKVALVSCRNLLIYFSPDAQAQAIAGFRFALRPGGVLFLGSSETPGDLGDELEPLNPTSKIYRRTDVRTRGPAFSSALPRERALATQSTAHSLTIGVQEAAQLLLEKFAPPSVLVNEHHDIIHFFGEPSPLLRLSTGTATLNLINLLPPSVASVVSLAAHRVLRDSQEATYHAIPDGRDGLITVSVRPLDVRGTNRLLLVSLTDERATDSPLAAVSGAVSLDAQRQIADLQQELLFSRENIQATIEELETSNEELQATNEELTAANEELQSTNEELQSVNEELHTLNVEYQEKIAELVHLNEDINNLLISTKLGSVFLDHELNVTRFTPAIAPVMRLLDRDIGRPISHLSIQLGVDAFFELLDQVRSTQVPAEKEFTLRDGQVYQIRVAPYVSDTPGDAGLVVTALELTAAKKIERQLARILDALPQHIALVDRDGVVTRVNRSWTEFADAYGADARRTGVGSSYVAAAEADPSAKPVVEKLRALLEGRIDAFDLEYPCDSPTEKRWFLLQAVRLESDDGGAVLSHLDITARVALRRGEETTSPRAHDA